MKERFTCSVRFKIVPDNREYVQIGDASGLWCIVPCTLLGHVEKRWMPDVVCEALNLWDRSLTMPGRVEKALKGGDAR